MKSASIYCVNKKQFNIAKAITENLMNGLLSVWGVSYTPLLVTSSCDFPENINNQKLTQDCDFEFFIKGWYSDTANIKYI